MSGPVCLVGSVKGEGLAIPNGMKGAPDLMNACHSANPRSPGVLVSRIAAGGSQVAKPAYMPPGIPRQPFPINTVAS
jgi:hypothetical protein